MTAWLDELRHTTKKKPLPILSFPCVSLLGTTVGRLTSDSDLQAEGMRLVACRTDAAAAVSFMLSENYGLYSKQKIIYSKLRPEFINSYTD